jgi:hypothetical protein
LEKALSNAEALLARAQESGDAMLELRAGKQVTQILEQLGRTVPKAKDAMQLSRAAALQQQIEQDGGIKSAVTYGFPAGDEWNEARKKFPDSSPAQIEQASLVYAVRFVKRPPVGNDGFPVKPVDPIKEAISEVNANGGFSSEPDKDPS